MNDSSNPTQSETSWSTVRPEGMVERDAQAVFDQAFRMHTQGRLEQAKALYVRVLDLMPDHFDATNLLGAIAVQAGEYDVALVQIDRALMLRSEDAMAYSNKGIALNGLGRREEAVASYLKSIELQPGIPAAHFNLGTVLAAQGRRQEALMRFDRALELDPAYADAYLCKGATLGALERTDEAIANVEKAIALNPRSPEAHTNLGVLYKQKGHWQKAIASHQKAIALKPEFAEAFVNLANVFIAVQQLEAALTCVGRALALRPDYAEAYSLRGSILHLQSAYTEAIPCFEKAIELRPSFALAHYNLGVSREALLQLEHALESYERAIDFDASFADAHGRKAVVLLLSGRLEDGWEEYEWRWRAAEAKGHQRHFSQPLWFGQVSLDGKTVLLHSEQGFGDTIQFCRYAQLVKALGAKVILEVPEGLMSVMTSLVGVDQLVRKGDMLPAFDLHCPLLSLPKAFKTSLYTIPSYRAYLRAPSNQREKWFQRLGSSERLRVGLVWSGNPHHKNDANRSIPLRALLDSLPQDFHYIPLQKVVSEEDRRTLSESGLVFCGDDIQDFSDTAAICDLLDVIVSVDTSVAHLAGALGKPVWILLPFVPDWRWLLKRDSSPWYPSARLYRQGPERDWKVVLQKVGSELLLFQQSVSSVEDCEETFQRGFSHHHSGQLPEAKQCYEIVLLKHPWHEATLNMRGVIAIQEGQYSLGLQWISMALIVNPGWAVAYLNRGVALNALGQLQLSKQSYDQSILLDPRNADAWYNRGIVLNRMQNVQEAIANYDEAIRLRPGFAAAYCNRGNALMRCGLPAMAIRSYDKAIEIQPDNALAHKGREAARRAMTVNA